MAVSVLFGQAGRYAFAVGDDDIASAPTRAGTPKSIVIPPIQVVPKVITGMTNDNVHAKAGIKAQIDTALFMTIAMGRCMWWWAGALNNRAVRRMDWAVMNAGGK